MPQAAVLAAIPAAAQLGGALIGNHANSNALNAQRRANDNATRLQSQWDADARSRYDRDYAVYQQRQSQRNDILRAVLGRYGVSFGEPAAAQGAAPGAAPAAPQAPVPGVQAPAVAAPEAPGSQFMSQRRPPGSGFSLADLVGMRR